MDIGGIILSITYSVYIIKHNYGYSQDIRPCILLDFDDDKARIALISSALDLYNPHKHFIIKKENPNFPLTGLKKTSYVSIDQIFNVKKNDLVKQIGILEEPASKELSSWIYSFSISLS